MNKGTKPSTNKPAQTSRTYASNLNNSSKRKSVTVSKDKPNNVKFSSFNSLVRNTNNQSTDLNNSRRINNNANSDSDLLMGGFTNNLNSNMSHKKFTNTYSSQMQDKLNKSRNSHKEDSLNMSRRLPTNTSANNFNPSSPNDKYTNFNSNNSSRNVLQGSANKNSSMHAQVNFPKPPTNFVAGNNTNAKKNISSGINLNLNLNNITNLSGLINNNNISNPHKNSLGDSVNKMQPNSNRESSENNNNVSDLKNRTNLQNNFTFNNNNNNWANSNMNNNTNTNTNGNIMTGPGNNTNNFNNNNSNITSTNQNQIFADDNIYVNSKNSKKADNDRERNPHSNNKYSNNSINDNNNLASKANGNIGKNKPENVNKFANDIAKSKGKNNVYDIFKGQTVKKPTTKTTTETKVNSSKISSIKNNNNNNTSLSSSIITNINKNNNQETNFINNNILNSIEIKRIPNDKETSLQNINLNNSQNLNENLNMKNSKILNSSSQINVGTSNNFDSSPIRPIKRDLNSLGNLNGSIGFSSIELKSANNNEKDSEKSVEKTTGIFNKYRNDNKANNKKNFGDYNSNTKNEGLNNPNNNNMINNNNLDNDPQEDDFNFNYNDEKIYSENQETSRKEIIEDDLDNFDNEKINENNALSTNNLNKFNHNRGKSNTYLTNEPLTSIEELDEKVLLQNTEENVKSSKENYVNSNTCKKDNNALNKNNFFNNVSNKKDDKTLENFNRSNSKEEREKNNKSSLNSFSIYNSSPNRKTYKNEVDQVDTKSNAESKRNQKGFDFKEDINNNNKNKQDLISIQNMTNNISPINNDGEIKLKKTNSDDLNLTPIVQLKDKDVYKKGAFQTRKSNDMFDLLVLKNLIDSKPDGSNSTTNNNNNINNPNSKTEKPIETQKIQKLASIDIDKNNNSVTQNNINNKKIEIKNSSNSLNNSKTVGKKGTYSPSKPLEKTVTSLIGKSMSKLTTQSKKTGSNNNNTSTLKSNKDNNTSSLNKDKPSFLDDLDSKNNSKIINTTQSRNLKTGGNELNSSKTFNKLLSPKELVKNVIATAKSIGKNRKTLVENKNPFVTGRNSVRKSVSLNAKDKSILKFGLNKTGLGNINNTMNSTLTEGKKRNNFISRSKLKTTKANQSDVQSNKMSRQSILGKIMSTRNIKGDDRTKNILTEIDRSFEVTSTQANQKRSLNPFNSLLRMSMSSFRDSYDFDFDRKFSGSLRSDEYNPLKRRNTKSFPDKFFKGNLYKKNSMMYSPEREIEDTLNRSNNSITGSGPCESLKIRINENHVISRTKCLPKTKKFAKYNKGKYELVESYDENFGWKRSYHPRELHVSMIDLVSLNEKDEGKEILIKPANLRKDQKDEINQKQFEKLQGNFIDESISKITKMNRLERMRANRHSSISVSPSRTLNNFCFSPMAANAASKKSEKIGGVGSPAIFSDRTIRNTTINDESVNYQSNNFTSLNNPNNISVIKAEKKIGNAKVLILENNFVICNADENKVFSPFENSILDINYMNTINANAPNTIGFIGGLGHVEVTSQNKNKLEKLERLEKISNTVLNLNKKNSNQGKSNNSLIKEKNNYNSSDENNYYPSNRNNDSALIESSSAFTIGHLNDLKKTNINNESNLNVIKNSSINTRRNKRNKILEAQNVINLFYQMHPEKNKYGYYSFAYNDEDYSSNAFTILKSSDNNGNNTYQAMNTINDVINVKNSVNVNDNSKKISNLANNLRSNLNKLEINNNIYQYEHNTNNPSQTRKNLDKPSISNLKKITFNLKDEEHKFQDNSNNLGEVLYQPDSNLRNKGDERSGINVANNDKNIKDNIFREAFKSGNFNINNLAAIANNKDPALNMILLEDKKYSFADNIRKNKESLNDPDFFDKVKNFLDVKRVKTQVIEQALLNPNSNTNKNTKNRISYGKFNTINQYVEKNIYDNMNKLKSIQIGTNEKYNTNEVNGKIKSYDSENLVIASSTLYNNPLNHRNHETHININNKFNTIDGNNDNNNLNSNKNNQRELIIKTQIPENSKVLREALNNINEIDSLNNLDSNIFVLPMNSRQKTTLQGNPEKKEKNMINDANIELVSEKVKKEKQIETLNQKFNEKLTAIKNTKNIKNYNGNNINRVIDDFHDFEFENFKSEFKLNKNQNEFTPKDSKDLKENLLALNNLKDGKTDYSKNNKKEGNDILISDEQLSEFKDKYLGKIEFLDKDKANLFYRKYLKGVNNNNANKLKNFFLVNKDEKTTQISEADKKEKELGMRLVNLKNMLNIDDPKKSREQKDLNALNFLYEKAERKNQVDNLLNNLSSSNLTNLLNLNESKINNINYNSAGSNSNNNTLKLLGNLSSLKFGSTLGNSIGSNNNNNNIHAFGNIGNNTNRENSLSKQALNKNQVNVASTVNTGRNTGVKDLKFSF